MSRHFQECGSDKELKDNKRRDGVTGQSKNRFSVSDAVSLGFSGFHSDAPEVNFAQLRQDGFHHVVLTYRDSTTCDKCISLCKRSPKDSLCFRLIIRRDTHINGYTPGLLNLCIKSITVAVPNFSGFKPFTEACQFITRRNNGDGRFPMYCSF